MEVIVTLKFASESEASSYLAGNKAGATSTASTGKPAADKPKTDAPKNKNTREAMVAIMTKLKGLAGADACRAIIKEVSGKEQKMADLPDNFIDGVFDGATKAIANKEAEDAAASDDV